MRLRGWVQWGASLSLGPFLFFWSDHPWLASLPCAQPLRASGAQCASGGVVELVGPTACSARWRAPFGWFLEGSPGYVRQVVGLIRGALLIHTWPTYLGLGTAHPIAAPWSSVIPRALCSLPRHSHRTVRLRRASPLLRCCGLKPPRESSVGSCASRPCPSLRAMTARPPSGVHLSDYRVASLPCTCDCGTNSEVSGRYCQEGSSSQFTRRSVRSV